MEFIATPTFSRKRKKLMADDDFDSFKQDLADAPEAGSVIVGTGGLRKIRYALPGRGKKWRCSNKIFLVNQPSQDYTVGYIRQIFQVGPDRSRGEEVGKDPGRSDREFE